MTIVSQSLTIDQVPYPLSSNGQQAYACTTFKTRSVQKPVTDLNLALPYALSVYRMMSNVGWGSYSNVWLTAHATVWQYADPFTSILNSDFSQVSTLGLADRQLYNKAYDKLVDQLKNESADLLTLLRERKLASDMIHNRLTQFGRLVDESVGLSKDLAYKSPKRRKARVTRRVGVIARLLSANPSDITRSISRIKQSLKKRDLVNRPSEIVLEFYWGWSPMVSDITNALYYLNSPPERISIYGSSKRVIDVNRTAKSGTERLTQYSNGTVRLRLGGQVEVTNRSLAEMERLGLTNLPQSLYETVPYSWLLDYFSSVGQIIASIDDDLICKLRNPYVTCVIKDALEHVRYENASYGRGWEFTRKRVHMRRQAMSIPKPLLTVFLPEVTFRRVVTGVALVALKLTKALPKGTVYNPR